MSEEKQAGEVGRREFIEKAGKFALIAPAMTFLLSTSMTTNAIAASGGGRAPTPAPQRPEPPKRHRRHWRHARRRRR